jgi:RecB family exonuclease
VEPTDFPTPHPSEITEISPSLANQLLSCPLRVAFSRDPDHKGWRRPSTYTALGNVAHALTEAAFKRRNWSRDPVAAKAELSQFWDAQVADEAAKLAGAWAPASPPPPDEWPGYSMTRARTVRRAVRQVTQPAGQQPGLALRTPGTGIEIPLRDEETGLVGRADRIESDGASTRVVDLKTGLRQDAPTEEQRRQLLLYAVLVNRTTGAWPSTIAVEDAAGAQYREPLDPAEATLTLDEVLAAAAAFNAATQGGDLISTAAPDADRCRWCAHRVVCGPYWSALKPEWGHRAVLGSVTASGISEEGTYVSLITESPTERSGKTVHVAGLAGPPLRTAKAAVVDWAGPAEVGEIRARWSTVVRAWD